MATLSAPADEIRDAGGDLLAPAPAAEDAVVSRAGLDELPPSLPRNPRAERVRRRGLAHAGDLVLLAFDGHQRRVADQLGPDAVLAPERHLSPRQIVPLEDAGDRLEVVLRRDVHHRQVVVVEPAVGLRALLVAREQVAIELPVRVRVPR